MKSLFKIRKHRTPKGTNRTINRLKWLSPISLSIINVSMALVSTFIPPHFYEQVVGEPSYMFLNISLYLFILMMWLSFIVGCVLSRTVTSFCVSSSSHISFAEFPNKTSQLITARVFLIAALFLSIVRALTLITGLSLDVVLRSIQGNFSSTQLRLMAPEVFEGTSLGFVSPFTVAVLVWSFWIGLRARDDSMPVKSNQFAHWVLFVAVTIVHLFEPLVLQTRGSILVLLLMLALLWFLHLWRLGRLTQGIYLRGGFFLLLFNLLVFIGIALQRGHLVYGNNFFESTYGLLIGYFPAAYNRLAAIIDGILILPSSGSGFYTMQFVWHFPLLARIFGFSEIWRGFGFNLLDSTTENWLVSFAAVWQAGLNGSFNWFTVFGCAYADYGWMAWVWFLLYGFISQVAWNRFLRGTPWGVVFYPWVAVSILAWWGAYNVFIARTDTIFMVLVPLLIGLSNRFISTMAHGVMRRSVLLFSRSKF